MQKPSWIKLVLSVVLFVTFLLVLPYLLPDNSTVPDDTQLLSTISQLEDRIAKLEQQQKRMTITQDSIVNIQLKIIETQHLLIEFLTNLFDTSIEKEITGYSPLDPKAVEGMCFSGDPSITASGHPSVPNWSIAAGPDIPFNSLIWIEGFGLRQVHDRGSRISNNHIDVMTETKEQAFAIGRGMKRVIIIRKGK